jgi:putative ABC transport system permease protein
MVRHLFKLIWNKKKQNFLLMTEMLVSFLVMFVVFTMIVFYYQNFTRPLGFNYDNVWNVSYDTPDGMRNADSIETFRASIRQMVQSMPQVQGVSFSSSNIPYGNSTMTTSISYNKTGDGSEVYIVDDNYTNVLGATMLQGRWFNKQDETVRERSIVINESLKESLFRNIDPIGKVIGDDADAKNNMRVVGIMQDIKDKGDYAPKHNGYFTRLDTTNMRGGGIMIIKVKPNAGAAFESVLYKALSNAIKNTSIDIKHMDKERTGKNAQMLTPVIVLGVIAAFLIINVALGLFGVLWYNINKRKAEIGLRRAVGASGNSIAKQLVGESMVLTTIALIVGTFFAVQFPLLNVFDIAAGTYIVAILLDILFIYVLVLICSLYPGKQAAAIYPAVALHED